MATVTFFLVVVLSVVSLFGGGSVHSKPSVHKGIESFLDLLSSKMQKLEAGAFLVLHLFVIGPSFKTHFISHHIFLENVISVLMY